jgi:hypothetical protein
MSAALSARRKHSPTVVELGKLEANCPGGIAITEARE